MLDGIETPETDTTAVVETPETAEVVAETPETQEVAETPETVEGEPEAEVTETEAAPDVTDMVSVTFAADDPEVETKLTEVLGKYELPADIEAAISFFKEKAEKPSADFADYADYGDADAVKALLDRQALLDSVTETETGYRPNTDQFAKSLDGDKADWLFFDLSHTPSQKYPGLSRFQEGIAEALAVEGDTVGSVLARYQQTIEALKTGATVSGAAPSFIPTNLQDAYWSLSVRERAELDQFDPSTDRIEYDESGRGVNVDEPIRLDKLATLAKIQKGIDNDKLLSRQEVQTKEQRQQVFHQSVAETQEKFYVSLRDTFAEDLASSVKFSDDPKVQTMMVRQNVALLTQAFSPTADGEFARQSLKDAGIEFNQAQAQQLIKDIETAAVALEHARGIKDDTGSPINVIELNKAKTKFEKAGRAWQAFASNILKQEAQLTSTGKQKDVDKAVEKRDEKKKLELKARPGTKGTATPVKHDRDTEGPPSGVRYGTTEWDNWYADKILNEQADRARSYAAR